MPTNRWLYDIATEWRRWRGQQGKLLLLLIGFALVCALLTLVLRLGQLLHSEKPIWLTAKGHYYTLANQSEQGQLQGISLQTLRVASASPGINAMSWLVPKTMTLTLGNQQLPDLQMMFYAPDWFSFSGMVNSRDQQGIWLSDRFWRQQFNATPAVIGEFVHHQRLPAGLKILGVLPASADRIGPWQADIWLSGDYLRYLTVFAVEDTRQVDRFLAAVPQYFGILRSEQALQPASLTERLNNSDLQVPGMRMQSSGFQLTVHAGINLDPQARQQLTAQWQLLLLLVIGMGIVLTLNLFTVYASRLVLWQAELRLFQVLGASRWQQLRPVLLAALLLVAVIGLLAAMFAQGLAAVIGADAAYQAITGSTQFRLGWAQFIAALSLVLLLFLLAGSLPLLRLEQQALFSRAMNPGRSRLQKLTAQTNLALQLLMALLALNVAGTLGLNLWQHYQHNPAPADVSVLSASQQGSGLDLASLGAGLVNGLPADQIAWSSNSFTSPQSLLIEDTTLPQPITIGQMWVSAGFFHLMGHPLPQITADWQNGIVINQTMADMLSRQLPGKPLLGSTLQLGILQGSQPIVAIVPDLPHYGRSSAPQPVAYVPLMLASSKIHFYVSRGNEPALVQWLQQQMTSPHISAAASLQSQIAMLDSARWQLLWSAIVVVLLIVLSVLISLSYQLKARLTLERHEYGVLLAVGAPDSYLQWRVMRQSMLALLLALPLVLALQSLLVHWGRSAVSTAVLFEPVAFIGASAVLTLLVLLCCQLPLYQLLRLPVYSVLRQQE